MGWKITFEITNRPLSSMICNFLLDEQYNNGVLDIGVLHGRSFSQGNSPWVNSKALLNIIEISITENYRIKLKNLEQTIRWLVSSFWYFLIKKSSCCGLWKGDDYTFHATSITITLKAFKLVRLTEINNSATIATSCVTFREMFLRVASGFMKFVWRSCIQ